MGTVVKRIPRPLGSTEISSMYNRTKDNEHYIRLHENIIHHYIRNNFSYCGRYMNIETFSMLTGIKDQDIRKGLVSYGEALKNISDDMTNSGIMRAAFQSAFFGIMEDRSMALQQYHILASEQQGKYVPFLSSEVGKAIKLVQDSTNGFMNFLKTMGTGISTLEPITPQGLPEEKGVTVDDVVNLLKEKKVTPLLQDNEAQEQLFIEHKLDLAPNVDARTQTGVDTSREGLNISKITSLQGLNEEVQDINFEEIEDKVTKHTNRRARQLRKDMEDI